MKQTISVELPWEASNSKILVQHAEFENMGVILSTSVPYLRVRLCPDRTADLGRLADLFMDAYNAARKSPIDNGAQSPQDGSPSPAGKTQCPA